MIKEIHEMNMKYIWQNGEIKNYADATVHVLTHSLHYGSSVYEGTRIYKTDQGAAIFHLNDHVERLFYSAKSIGMSLPYSKKVMKDATVLLVEKNKLESGYIRHLAYYGVGNLRIAPQGLPVEIMIACWPWGRYLSDQPIDVKVSAYKRISAKSTVTDAKIAGNYVNSILTTIEIQNTHYKESLLLDEYGFVAEAGSANLFCVKNNIILTPKIGAILPGITRKTVIEIAKELGYEVQERNLSLDEVYSCDEAFLTGTAAELTSIRSINDNFIGNNQHYPVSTILSNHYMDLVHGRLERHQDYLTLVK